MFYFIAPFLAMAELKQAWLCSSGLTKRFHFMAPFLAMAELKQAWLCSSGLTKRFSYFSMARCLARRHAPITPALSVRADVVTIESSLTMLSEKR